MSEPWLLGCETLRHLEFNLSATDATVSDCRLDSLTLTWVQLWPHWLEINGTHHSPMWSMECSHICLFLIIHPAITTILAKIKQSGVAHYFGNTAHWKLISCRGRLPNPPTDLLIFPIFKAQLPRTYHWRCRLLKIMIFLLFFHPKT